MQVLECRGHHAWNMKKRKEKKKKRKLFGAVVRERQSGGLYIREYVLWCSREYGVLMQWGKVDRVILL